MRNNNLYYNKVGGNGSYVYFISDDFKKEAKLKGFELGDSIGVISSNMFDVSSLLFSKYEIYGSTYELSDSSEVSIAKVEGVDNAYEFYLSIYAFDDESGFYYEDEKGKDIKISVKAIYEINEGNNSDPSLLKIDSSIDLI